MAELEQLERKESTKKENNEDRKKKERKTPKGINVYSDRSCMLVTRPQCIAHNQLCIICGWFDSRTLLTMGKGWLLSPSVLKSPPSCYDKLTARTSPPPTNIFLNQPLSETFSAPIPRQMLCSPSHAHFQAQL
jgi:hypothetical protein